MNTRFLVILLIILSLLLAGAFLINRLLQDTGYALLIWQGWQIQTTAGLWIILSLASVIGLAAFSLLLIWLFMLPYRIRAKAWGLQQHQSARALKLASLYQLLHAPQQAYNALQSIDRFEQNDILPLLRADYARQAGQSEQVAKELLQAPTDLSDIALLIAVKSGLRQGQVDTAVPQLKYLLTHTIPGESAAVVEAFHREVQWAWGQYALLQPEQALQDDWRPHTIERPILQTWLNQLAYRACSAGLSQQSLQALLALYETQPDTERDALAAEWLAIFLHYPAAYTMGLQLAHQSLQQRFTLPVLSGWLGLVVQYYQATQDSEAAMFAKFDFCLSDLMARYPAQPALLLSQAVLHQLQGNLQAVQHVLQQWPNTTLSKRFTLLWQALQQPTLYGQIGLTLIKVY